MSFPTTNLVIGDRWSIGYKNYEWNGSDWEENEICIPEHHWKFNESSGATYVSDSGSIPKQLSQTGTTSLGNNGKIYNSGLVGNTSGDAFHSSSNEAISILGVTVSAWIKLNNNSSTHTIYALYPSSIGIYFQILSSSIRVRFGTGTNGYKDFSTTLSTNRWYHVAFIYRSDGTNGLFSCYLNGALLDTASNTHSTVTLSQSTDYTTSAHYVGNLRDNASSTKLDGYIEDVRVYHRPISDLDIANIYNYGLGTHSQFNVPGYPTRKFPVHHWKLDEDGAEGTMKMSDSGTSPVILTENGSISQTTPPILSGKRSYFVDEDNYFSGTFAQTENYSSWSIGFYVNKNISANIMHILYFGISNWDNTIRLYANSNAVVLNYRGWYSDISHSASNSGEYYFVITYDYENESLSCYMDGVYVNSNDADDPGSITVGTSDTIQIGHRNDTTGTSYIDDVKMWDYELTPEEIENEYYLYIDQKKSL